MVSPEERALIRSSAILTESVQYCPFEVTDVLYAEGLIPRDLRDKVTKDPSNGVRDVVACLISRTRRNPREFVRIVGFLEQVLSLKSAVDLLKGYYCKCEKCFY